MTAAPAPRPPSLLWPSAQRAHARKRLSDETLADLDLPRVAAALVGDAPLGRRPARERFAAAVLRELVTEPDVIAYRCAVLSDLLARPELRVQLTDVLPRLEALADTPAGERYRPAAEPGLEAVPRRLADLELLLDVVVRLDAVLSAASPTSAGLRHIAARVAEIHHSRTFEALERELPGLRATLATVKSVSVGINLGPDLQPASATILGFSSEPVEGRRSLLWSLMGDGAEQRGISPLQRGEGGPRNRSNELLRDLRHLLGRVVEPVRAALAQYDQLTSADLRDLGAELAFLLGAARLVLDLRERGLPMCPPAALPASDRRVELVDAYDLGLAVAPSPTTNSTGPTIVTNAITFDPTRGRVWVLTGPNHGGKTTYTRAVGVAQTLFQAGLYVPASSARMSPVDAIFTHFPAREDARPGEGRLDAEAERLAAIFRGATPHSLILLNEALAGTSALEALDLARGVVRALRVLGARAIYVTHLHELAAVVGDINATTPGDGTVASLVAIVGEAGGPYRIQPGPPSGRSYAAEIAERHGISFVQLSNLLRDRSLTDAHL
jgi:hypothetical protein